MPLTTKTSQRQPDQPHQEGQQQDAEDKRQRKADPAGATCLRLGNPRHDDGQEDDVVDAENDFERRERQQRRPGFSTGEKMHHALSDRRKRMALSLATT